jgi:hypothetical protein
MLASFVDGAPTALPAEGPEGRVSIEPERRTAHGEEDQGWQQLLNGFA